MEKATIEIMENKKEIFMSDRTLLEEERRREENSTGVAVKTDDGSAACPMQGKGWFKGALGMAICCGAPLLLIAAISFFGCL